MPCCAPRYGPLIVATIDFSAGITGLILLFLGKHSKLVIVSITLPALILPWLGLVLAIAFLKKNSTLATVAFATKILLVTSCTGTIVILLIHPELKSNSYTPVFIAGLIYAIVLQLHFSWVVYDFKNRRLHNHRFQSLESFQ